MGKGNKPQKNDKASMKPKKEGLDLKVIRPSTISESVYQLPRTGTAL